MLSDAITTETVVNAAQSRFELWLNGDLVGIMGYYESELTKGGRAGRPMVVSFMHTVITEDFGHRGLAGVLVRGALDHARVYGWKVRPVCTYVQRFLADNPEYREVVVPL